MIRTTLAGLAVVTLVSVAGAQEIRINIPVTVPAAAKADMAEMLATMPPLYTNDVVVANGKTNVVQKIVTETPAQRFRRLSEQVLRSYWAANLRRFRQEAIPMPDAVLTTAE